MIRLKAAELHNTRDITLLVQKCYPALEYDNLYRELHKIIGSEEGIIYVVINNGIAVAMAQCELKNNDYTPSAVLERICAAEEWQKKHVYGRMIEKCKKWAKRKGCKELSLNSLEVQKEYAKANGK